MTRLQNILIASFLEDLLNNNNGCNEINLPNTPEMFHLVFSLEKDLLDYPPPRIYDPNSKYISVLDTLVLGNLLYLFMEENTLNQSDLIQV